VGVNARTSTASDRRLAVAAGVRDREIVEWIARLGAADTEQVARRFGLSKTWAYERVSRLVRERMLERVRPLPGVPALLVATQRGLRWCGLGRLGRYRVGVVRFVHANAVVDTAVGIELAHPEWVVMGERELRALERETGEVVGSSVVGELPNGAPRLHRPDLLVHADGRTIAVEVELSLKAADLLTTICRGWARSRVVDEVWYLAAPRPAHAVRRAVAAARAHDRVKVFDYRAPEWRDA